jgi:hypothetical protein
LQTFNLNVHHTCTLTTCTCSHTLCPYILLKVCSHFVSLLQNLWRRPPKFKFSLNFDQSTLNSPRPSFHHSVPHYQGSDAQATSHPWLLGVLHHSANFRLLPQDNDRDSVLRIIQQRAIHTSLAWWRRLHMYNVVCRSINCRDGDNIRWCFTRLGFTSKLCRHVYAF